MAAMPAVDQRTALATLSKSRLLQVAAALGLGLPGRLLKSELVDAIAASTRAPFPDILDQLLRDELKAICRAADIDDSGPTKAGIADRILGHRPGGGKSTLTKAELATAVAATAGVLKKEAEVIVNAMFETMTEHLRTGSSIEIRGFGSFGLRQRRARIGHNPKTREEIQVPAKRVCFFRPGKSLRRM